MARTGSGRTEHRCAACGRLFALVCGRPSNGTSLPLYVACPRCGVRGLLFVPGALTREADGAFVLSLDYRAEEVG